MTIPRSVRGGFFSKTFYTWMSMTIPQSHKPGFFKPGLRDCGMVTGGLGQNADWKKMTRSVSDMATGGLKQFPFSHYLNIGDERWANLRNFCFYVQTKDLDFRFKNYVRFYFYNPKIYIFNLRITCVLIYNPKNKFVLNIGVLNIEIYPRFFHNFSFNFLLKLNEIPILINIDKEKFLIFPSLHDAHILHF